MSIKKTKYNTGFAVGGMYHHEFVALESIIQNDDFETLLKADSLNNEYLAITKEKSRKIVISEILRMYKQAPSGFWDAFYSWDELEQKTALFYLRLKTYSLLFDLHFEVGVRKYKVGDGLQAFDITMRLDELASIDAHIASWSESTMTKLNSRYRGILTEIGLYNAGVLRSSSVDSSLFWNFFEKCNEAWFLEACFIR